MIRCASLLRGKKPVPSPLFFASKRYSMDLSFIRRNLRSFLRIPENTLAVSASLPTAALGGSPPELQLVRSAQTSPAASATAGPGALRVSPNFRPNLEAQAAYRAKREQEENDKLVFGYQSKMLSAKTAEAKQQVLIDWAKFREAQATGRPAPRAKSAPLEDDNQTVNPTPPADDPENPPGVDSVLDQLLDLLTELRKLVATSPDDDEEATAAIGHYRAGRKLTASRALMALNKKLCQRPKLTPQARIARGYNAQDSVKAIQAALRPGPRTAPAAGTASTATTSTAASALASPSDRRAKVAALRAERAALETSMQKSGIYDNKSIARQQQISAELKMLHVS